MVNNLAAFLLKAKESGRHIVGAVVERGETLLKAAFPFPVCLLLGSEGKGIRHGLMKLIDKRISVPMEGAGLSFNVGVSCAIFCYEIARQRPG